MSEKYKPSENPRLRVVEAMGRRLIVLGMPGEATFDVTADEGIKLGIALMETSLGVRELERAEQKCANPASETSGDKIDAAGNRETGENKKDEGGDQ